MGSSPARSTASGVVLAPLLHGGWAHLISNSVPFLVLGALVMTYGLSRRIKATGFITIVAGLATRPSARSGNHIGASILVFGYFGFLLGMAWFERSVKSIGIAVLVAVIYGGLIEGGDSDEFRCFLGGPPVRHHRRGCRCRAADRPEPAAGERLLGMASETYLEVDGEPFRISSPDKILFPDQGWTKLDVAEHFLLTGRARCEGCTAARPC